MKFKTQSLFLIIAFTLFLVACGGGGGGGSDTPTNTIVYTGLTSKATIDEQNAVGLSTDAFNGGMSANAFSNVASLNNPTNNNHILNLDLYNSAIALKNATFELYDISQSQFASYKAVVSEHETISGSCGGQANGNLSIDDVTGEFWGDFVFINYCDSNITLNGDVDISGKFDLITETIRQINFDFSYLNSTQPSGSYIIDGTLSISINSSNITINMEMLLHDGNGGDVFWINGYSLVADQDSQNTYMTISGKYYDPYYGYVLLSTQQTFIVSINDTFPSSGILIVGGKNGPAGGPTMARLTCYPSGLIQVEADNNGDGVYNWESGMLDWYGSQVFPPDDQSPPDDPTCTDSDNDNFYLESSCGTVQDCNDNDRLINPDAYEVCNDTIDNDCDGKIDCLDSDCKSDSYCEGNMPPVANAGADQSITTGNSVFFDGGGSSDADGDALSFLWMLDSAPNGSTASIISNTTQTPSITPDVDGTYTIILVVNDGTTDSVPDTVNIVSASVSNTAPVANAGQDVTFYVGSTVILDGSGSSDDDGDALTYQWSGIAPPSSTATLLNTETEYPYFVADVAGIFTLSLIVNDGAVDSEVDSVIVTVISLPVYSDIVVYSGDTYLGCWSCNDFDTESIHNSFSQYGSELGTYSIRNDFGLYGSSFSPTSACNTFASSPPRIVDNNYYYGTMSINTFNSDSICNQLSSFYSSGDCAILQYYCSNQ